MKRPLAMLAGLVLAISGTLAATAPAAHAATSDGIAKAVWVNDTLRVTYSLYDTGPGLDEAMEVHVDGETVDAPLNLDAHTTRLFQMTRKSTAGPARVEVVAINSDDQGEFTVNTPTTVYSATVQQHVVHAEHGQVAASSLLDKLEVAKESHAGSYKRSKFKLWVDANHDGENTRAEVLVAESKKRVTENSHHTVKTGRWTSPYDGTTFTTASKLDIDHLVPLEEAWTSGAYAWSIKKRTAFANDIGYGPSLIAVSEHANRSKGDREPNAYLPSRTSYTCAYVRNYIAVKYRWGLKVDTAEKTALKTDLALYCINPYVTKPGKPNLSSLVGATAAKPAPSTGSGSGSGSGSSSVYYKNCDAVRAAGKAPLYAGQPGYATPRLDRDGDGVACE